MGASQPCRNGRRACAGRQSVGALARSSAAGEASVSQVPRAVCTAASMRLRRGGADWPHTASRRTHARPRLEAATLRVRAVTKVRAYVARHQQLSGRQEVAAQQQSQCARCRTRARRAASRESARRAVERRWTVLKLKTIGPQLP